MHAEVIAIGDELTSGQRLDTNSQWLSERLGELGIRTLYHSTVGDDIEANRRVFREAFDRSDIILCTGGLGPTADDLTRQAVAETIGVELVLDEASLGYIRSMFARRKREMPKRNKIQAMFPVGSRAIPNPHGTAPGIDLVLPRKDRNDCRLFALPGVPAEMREMWEQTVRPAIQQITGNARIICHHSIKCFGVGESDLEQMLPDVIARGREPSVGITVHKATITLRVMAAGPTEDDCREAMAPRIDSIRDCLGTLVFGKEDDELQDAVVRLLCECDASVATVELGSGGLLANWMTEADPQQQVFRGGTVVRGPQAFDALVFSDTDIEEPQDQAAIVGQMAKLGREQFETDYALAVGAFPGATELEGEPGSVSFAIASRGGTLTKTVPFAGHPDILKERAVKQALNFLRLTLLS